MVISDVLKVWKRTFQLFLYVLVFHIEIQLLSWYHSIIGYVWRFHILLIFRVCIPTRRQVRNTFARNFVVPFILSVRIVPVTLEVGPYDTFKQWKE